MSNSKTESLVSLINVMSKSEKRHFKLYCNRLPVNNGTLYLKIFDLLEDTKLIDDAKIRKKLELKNTTQFINSKRHLYSQILRSLRLLYAKKHSQIGINEEIDYATILAHKNLYEDSYEYLERLDIPINELYTQNLLNVTELKRRLSSHLDHTHTNFDNLISHTRSQLEIDWEIDDVYNELRKDFSLLGFTRNERENTLRYERFVSKIEAFNFKPLNLLQRFNYHELNVLFKKSNLNFFGIYKSALKQYYLLEDIPYNKNEEYYIKLLMQCLPSLLEVCCECGNRQKFNYWYSMLLGKIDKFNLSKDKHGGALVILPENLSLLHGIINNSYAIDIEIGQELIHQDSHELLLIKTRYLAYQGLYDEALGIINMLLNESNLSIETSLYSRLYQVLFHYRLSNFELVENLLPALRLAFKTGGHFNKTINAVLTLTSKGVKYLNFGMKDEITDFQNKLKVYYKTPYENIPFLYFDFYNWFESIKLDIHLSELKHKN